MAKGRKTGGRSKGTPNKSTAVREAEIAASGLTPMQYFMNILRSEKPEGADPAQVAVWETNRFSAAKELMPYCHARLASVEANVNHSASESVLERLAQAEADGAV